jgi:hypothetical protein
MEIHETDARSLYEMRDFIELCQDYNQLVFEEMEALHAPSLGTKEIVTESVLVGKTSHPILGDLHDVVDQLRAFMESSGGDYALGVEEGMQRAAEMVETLLKRHEDK